VYQNKKTMIYSINVKTVKSFTFLTFVCLLIANTSQAQDWEAGGWMGTAHYFGDLNPDFSLSNPELGGGLIIRYNFNKRLAVKLGGNMGSIVGNDAFSDDVFQRNRNLSFRSDIREGSLEFEFNFLTYEHGSKDNRFTPYMNAGISLFNFNPQAQYEGVWYDLQPLGTEGQFRGEEYALTQPAFVYGGGFKVDVSFEWSLNIFFSSRRLFTDYLDDVSTVYADKDDLEEVRDELSVILSDRTLNDSGQVGRQRGNSQTNDSFHFIGIGLVYNFARINCPWF
jgi:hypothetical protein